MKTITFTFLLVAFFQTSLSLAIGYTPSEEDKKMNAAKSYLFTHTYSLSAMNGTADCLSIQTPVEDKEKSIYSLKFNGGKKFLILSPEILKNVKVEKEIIGTNILTQWPIFKYSVNYSISKYDDGTYPIEKVMISLTKKCPDCFFESVKVLSVEMSDPYTTTKKTQINCFR